MNNYRSLEHTSRGIAATKRVAYDPTLTREDKFARIGSRYWALLSRFIDDATKEGKATS